MSSALRRVLVAVSLLTIAACAQSPTGPASRTPTVKPQLDETAPPPPDTTNRSGFTVPH